MKWYYDRFLYPAAGTADELVRLQLEGRHELSRKLSAEVRIPYVINKRINYHAVNGLADIAVGLRWMPTVARNARILQRVAVSAHLELPTGRSIVSTDVDLPPGLSAGSASLDLRLGLAHVMRGVTNGVATEVHGFLNTRSRTGYRFGHQVVLSAVAFHEFAGTRRVTLFAGPAFAWKGPDNIHDRPVTENAGSEWLGQVGLRISSRQLAVTGKCDVPLLTRFELGMQHQPRYLASVSVFFNKKTKGE